MTSIIVNTAFVAGSFFKLPKWSVLAHFLRVEFIRPFDTDLLHWEWISLGISLALLLNPWVIRKSWLTAIRRWFHRYAQKRTRAIVTCMLFPVVVRLAFLPVVPLKPPSVHDEFSLLLMADTFRDGRLTNPTHPLWRHFETVHEIQRPTYNSMYPPGFAVFLALGELFNEPWIGVLVTVALMCGALCWMLQAWLPPAWALGGGLVAATQIAIGSFWVNSYVGGATVPVMAGALMFGAIPRFLRKPSPALAALFAAGVVFLENTRPFEGTVITLISCGLGFFLYRKSLFGRPHVSWKLFIPAAGILLAGALFTTYYSWRVTGSPLKTAYEVNRETYGWPENLAFLPPKKLTYRHKILENVEVVELSHRLRYATFGRMLDSWSARAFILWAFYVGPGLTAALLLMPWVFKSRKMRPLIYIILFMLGLNALQLMAYPQHAAQEVGIFYLVLTVAMRQMYVWLKRKGFAPERMIAAMVLAVFCGAILNLAEEQLHFVPLNFWEWPHWQFYRPRADMVAKLEQMPGKHLVVVRYSDWHTPHEEWVYNDADIDHSKIVWANYMGPKDDRKLLDSFKDRQAWIIDPDVDENSFFPLTSKTYPGLEPSLQARQ